MKIRNPRWIGAAGWLGTQAIRGLFRTLRFEHRQTGHGPSVVPPRYDAAAPRCIYLVWHETLLMPIARFSHPQMSTLVSKHADGQLLASFIKNMGLSVVYGSTNRGGVQAMREIIRDVTGCRHMAITPDGPRGPRRVIQAGAIFLASRTGMQIAPVGIAYSNPWRARSWDRFAVPRPCSRAKMVSSEAFVIPPQIRSEGLERYRVLVQAELDRLTAIAEHWADTNRFDESVAPPARERIS